MLTALRRTVDEYGVRGLWRGLAPPLIGSVAYRSSQMGVFAYFMAHFLNHSWARARIPGSGGVEVRVVLSAAAATTARALIETPLEVIKIRRQLGLPPPASAAELVRGFGLTWARLYVALGSFFVLCDSADRHAPALFATPLIGPFLKGGVAATAGWWLAWPLEVAKSRVQSGLYGGGALAALRGAVAAGNGWRGLYRGLGPGSARSLVGNGAALAAYEGCVACFAI